jgi:hypothetical protein
VHHPATKIDDPDDQRDWEQKLPNMHRYYQNTAITLVIESVNGGDEGFSKPLFPGSKDARGPRSIPILVPEESGNTWSIEHDSVFHIPIANRMRR